MCKGRIEAEISNTVLEKIINVELKFFNLRFDAVSLFSLGSTQLTGSDTLTCID